MTATALAATPMANGRVSLNVDNTGPSSRSRRDDFEARVSHIIHNEGPRGRHIDRDGTNWYLCVPPDLGEFIVKVLLALERLLESYPIEQITSGRLAREAGISRSTFYRQYASVDDVLVNCSITSSPR